MSHICRHQVQQCARLLKLAPGATLTDCKLAYFRMAKLSHPDIASPGQSGPDFRDVSEAYEVLRNFYERESRLPKFEVEAD